MVKRIGSIMRNLLIVCFLWCLLPSCAFGKWQYDESATMNQNLVAHYTFNDNEPSFVVKNEADEANTATSSVFTNVLSNNEAIFKRCFNFRKTNVNYVDTCQTFNSTLTDSFSASFWTQNFVTVTGYEWLCGARGAGGLSNVFVVAKNASGFSANPGGVVFVQYMDNAGASVTLETKQIVFPPNDSRWRFVAVVMDNSARRLRVYIDGVESEGIAGTSSNGVFDNTLNMSTFASPVTFCIGSAKTTLGIGADSVEGRIDDFKLFDKAISADEVRTLYLDGVGRQKWQRLE